MMATTTTAAFFGIVLAVDLLAVVCQVYCQPIARFDGAALLLFPVILAYGALALPFAGTLALAFCNGLLWDALTVQILQPGVYLAEAPTQEARLGWSILLFALLAVLTHGLRPLFLRGRWDLHCLASGVCTVVILASQYAMITFVRGGLVVPRDAAMRVLLPGFFAMVLAPFVYFGFYAVANLLGYPVRADPEEERRRRQKQPERL